MCGKKFGVMLCCLLGIRLVFVFRCRLVDSVLIMLRVRLIMFGFWCGVFRFGYSVVFGICVLRVWNML